MNLDKNIDVILLIFITSFILTVSNGYLYYYVNPIKVIITSDKSYIGNASIKYHIINVTLPDGKQYQFTLPCNYYKIGDSITISKDFIFNLDWSPLDLKLPQGCRK